MTDDQPMLRAQIANVLATYVPDTDPVSSMADAVIAALGLREERVGLLTRYVTDWEGRSG